MAWRPLEIEDRINAVFALFLNDGVEVPNCGDNDKLSVSLGDKVGHAIFFVVLWLAFGVEGVCYSFCRIRFFCYY